MTFFQALATIVIIAIVITIGINANKILTFNSEVEVAQTLRRQQNVVATMIAQSMGDYDGDSTIEVLRVNFGALNTPLTTTVNAGEATLPTGAYYILSSYNTSNRTDPYGNPYAICIVDNGTTTSGTGYIAGANSSASTAFSVVSAGPDKIFQTSCANAVLQPATVSGDDFVRVVTQSESEFYMGNVVNRGSNISDLGAGIASTKLGIGVTPNAGSRQLTVARDASIGTDLAVSGNLTVAGTATLGAVSQGATTMSSLSVTGNASVTGTSTLNGATVTSMSNSGNESITGTLTVTGNTSLGALTASANASFTTLSTSGLATLNSAAITNNATVGGTFGVTGAATFSNNVTIPNGTSSAPSLRFSTYTSNGLYAGNDAIRGGLNGNFTGIAAQGGPGFEIFASTASIVGIAPPSVSSGTANTLLIRGGETNGSGVVGGSVNIGTGTNTVDGDSGTLNLFTRGPAGTNRWSGAVQIRSNAANTGAGGGTGSVRVFSGDANAGSSGWTYVYTGNTTGANRPGRVNISSGENTGSAGSGDINIEVGRTYGTGQGGTLYLSGGRTMSGATAGNVEIIGGASESTGQTGYVQIRGGNTNSVTSPHILVYGASQGYMSFNGLSFFGHTSGPASLFFNPTYGGEGIFGPNGTNVGFLGDSSYIWGRSHIRDGYFYNILRVNGNDVWHNGNFPANPLTGVAVGRVLAWNGTQYVPTTITAAGGGGGVTVTEDDPQVNTVNNGGWCVGGASGVINCTTSSPVATGTPNTVARFNTSGNLISSNNMTFDTDGEVNFATGLETPYVTYTSDSRLKNWEGRDSILDDLKSIRVGYYEPNAKGLERGMPNRKTWGVLAQDVEKVLAPAVKIDKDGWRSVDYPMLAAYSLAGIQDLDNKINDLTTQLNEKIKKVSNGEKIQEDNLDLPIQNIEPLKEKTEKIENKINDLQNQITSLKNEVDTKNTIIFALIFVIFTMNGAFFVYYTKKNRK